MARANARTEALGAAGAIVAVAPAGRSALQRAGVSLRLLGDRSGLDFDGGALSAAADAAAEREAAAAAHAEPAAPGAAPLTLEEAVQAALAVSTAAAQPFGPKPAGVDDPVELRAGVGGSGHDHGPDGAPPPAPAVKPDPGAAPNAPPAPAAVKPDPGAVASGSAAPLPPHAPRAAVPPPPPFRAPPSSSAPSSPSFNGRRRSSGSPLPARSWWRSITGPSARRRRLNLPTPTSFSPLSAPSNPTTAAPARRPATWYDPAAGMG